MATNNQITVRQLVAFLESCDQDETVRFTGWQCVTPLTICEMWKAKKDGAAAPVITFEEIN